MRVDVRGGDPQRFVTGLRRAPGGGYVFRARELGEASYTRVRRLPALAGGRGGRDARRRAPRGTARDGRRGRGRRGEGRGDGCVASVFGRFPVERDRVRRAGVRRGRASSSVGSSRSPARRSRSSSDPRRDPPRCTTSGSRCTSSFTWERRRSSGRRTGSRRGSRRTTSRSSASARAGCARKTCGATSPGRCRGGFARKGPPPRSRSATTSTRRTGAGRSSRCSRTCASARRRTGSGRSTTSCGRRSRGWATRRTRSPLADFVRVGDEATGTRVLADLVAHDAVAGEPVDLAGLWRALGVVAHEDGSVELRADAPEAALRRGISAGPGH